MAVDEAVSGYSTTASSNTPAGTTTIGPDLDNHLRDIKKNIAALSENFKDTSDGVAGGWDCDPSASPTWTYSVREISAGGKIAVFNVDLSAETTTPYMGGSLPSTYTQDTWDEGTGSVRTTVMGNFLGDTVGQSTASARETIVGPILGPASLEDSTASALTRLGGGATAASQTELESASATDVFTTPGRQQYHPSAAKCWGAFDGTSSELSFALSFNCTSLTDNGVGSYTVTIATDFSNANYAALVSGNGLSDDVQAERFIGLVDRAAGSFRIDCENLNSSQQDFAFVDFVCFGDQ